MQRISVIIATCMLSLIATASAQVPQEPRFSSGGLNVKLNRATPPDKNGNFVLSLVITNTDKATAELFTMRGVQAVTDRGSAYEDVSLGGLPFCVEYESRGCHAAIAKGALTPLSIDQDKSAVVTLSFAGDPPSGKVCAIDFSLPIHRRDRNATSPDAWRVVAVGLPNIKVC